MQKELLEGKKCHKLTGNRINLCKIQKKLVELALLCTQTTKEPEIAAKHLLYVINTGLYKPQKLASQAFLSQTGKLPSSIYLQSICYEYGLGVEINPPKTLELLKEA